MMNFRKVKGLLWLINWTAFCTELKYNNNKDYRRNAVSMKSKFAKVLLLISIIIFSICSVSCGKKDSISTEDLTSVAEDISYDANNTVSEVETAIEEAATEKAATEKAAAEEERKKNESARPGDVANAENIELYAGVFKELDKLREGSEDYDSDMLAGDILGYIYERGASGNNFPLFYDFKDLNNDGTIELLIGSDYGPICLYTIRNGSIYAPDLTYYYGILADGTIHTMQGNGIPDDAHRDGYYFQLQQNGEVRETNPTTDEKMEFDWKHV